MSGVEVLRVLLLYHLMEALQGEAAARGIDQIELDVWLFNDEAREVYERLGFEPIMQRMRLRSAQEHKRADDSRGGG